MANGAREEGLRRYMERVGRSRSQREVQRGCNRESQNFEEDIT